MSTSSMDFFRSSYTMDSVHDGKRVISFFIWDPELEKKIDREIKMIDGISKLLNVASDLAQTIECHKALILSQQRMLAFMAEIQRKQKNLLLKDKNQIEPTKATLTLTDIRIPLNWKEMKAKTEQKKFAVFCLIRIGCEIIDTQMKFVDKNSNEIYFEDKTIFENVGHEFEMILEIFALNRSLALSSSAKEFADRYRYYAAHGSPSLTRKLDDLMSNQDKTSNAPQSKFILIARTIFTKQSVNRVPIERDLIVERRPDNPLMQLPIQKKIVARLHIQPICYTRLLTFNGILRIGTAQYICSLTAGFLNGEQIMYDDYSDQHRFSIPITNTTMVLSNYDDLSFTVYNRGFDAQDFFVQDLIILDNWTQALQQHIVDIQAWEQSIEHLPAIRRYSQHMPATPSLSNIGTKVSHQRTSLRAKARSLDNLHQLKISSDSLDATHHDEMTNLDDLSIPIDTNKDQSDDSYLYRTRF